MKTIVYKRASTDLQAYDQQNRTIQIWLDQNGIKADIEREEKISGSKSHKERILFSVINECEPRDQIVVSEFSRLSRSMSDAANIVDLCIARGVNLISIKENLRIQADNPNDITTKLMTMIFGLAAELERSNIRSRTQSGLNCIKDTIKKQGFAVGKRSGRTFTKLGNNVLELHRDKAQAASASSRLKKKVESVSFRQTYELASLLHESGLKNPEIATRLNASGYKTSKGCEFIPATVSRLLRDGKKLLQNT